MIAILDYGLGNLGSIANMLKVIGEKPRITNDKAVVNNADGVILPGVGAFDSGMSKLVETGLIDAIKESIQKGKPVLGICLGMQMLGKRSEEGNLPGLNLIPFECKRFCFDNTELKIPHMGWDIVDIKKAHPLVKDLKGTQRYYFVHSFHAVCEDEANILMTCDYGYKFAAAVIKENVMGVQFHPEKSHDFGLALLKNFVAMCREQ